MRTGVILSALGLAAIVLASGPTPQLTQAEAEAEVAKVLPELAAIRGFDFKAKVPVTVIDDAKRGSTRSPASVA